MISSKFYEGLEAVLYIALNSGAGPVSSKDISSSQGKLPRHLEPVLQLLVQNGILKGTKGPKGGYTLAKEKRKITIATLYKIFLSTATKSTKQSPLFQKICAPLQKESENKIIQYFEQTTLEDLCKKSLETTPTPKKSDNFNI